MPETTLKWQEHPHQQPQTAAIGAALRTKDIRVPAGALAEQRAARTPTLTLAWETGTDEALSRKSSPEPTKGTGHSLQKLILPGRSPKATLPEAPHP